MRHCRAWPQQFDANQPDRWVLGIDVGFDSTAARTRCTLAVRQQQFTLSVAGTALLPGAQCRRRLASARRRPPPGPPAIIRPPPCRPAFVGPSRLPTPDG